MSYNKIKQELKIRRIKNILELTNYSNEKLSIHLSKINTQTNSFNSGDNEKTHAINSETFVNSEIFPSDILNLFKKPWDELLKVHQNIKIKEYCKKISITKEKSKSLEKSLISNYKKKKLLKQDINYDSENGVIIYINQTKL